MTPDPDRCVHGMPIEPPCFFCRNRPEPVSTTSRLEHRNPRAVEPKRGRSITIMSPRRAAKQKPRPTELPEVQEALRIEREQSPVSVAPARGAVDHGYQPIPRALRRLQNLERELERMREILARTVADLKAAQNGRG